MSKPTPCTSTWYDTPFGRLVTRQERAGRRHLTVAETMAELLSGA
jgi:hypothetical protein